MSASAEIPYKLFHSSRIFLFILYIAILTVLFPKPSISADTPFNRIQALKQTPTIDGIIQPGEWPEQHQIRLSRAFHDKKGIHLYFSYDDQSLYLGAYIEDADLRADGNGQGQGNIWDHYNDDSIEWYFDLNNSRDAFFMPDDRMLALNIGNFSDPIAGAGIVSRRSFNQGNAQGGAAGAIDPVTLTGILYRVHHMGTVNNPADIDQGYSMEVAIPWSTLSRNPPKDGELMGINMSVVSDDTGGVHDWSDNRGIEPAHLRFTTPVRPDEYVELRHSPGHGSQSGLNGPAYYQTMQFHQERDTVAPNPVGNLGTSNPRPYSVKLHWRNSGDNGQQGVAAGFEVRYSTAPIHSDNLSSAQQWPLNIFPKAAGDLTTIRVMGLQPDTPYYLAVRAYDEAGNFSQPAITKEIRTTRLSTSGNQISADHYKGSVQVTPKGRYFMTENGQHIIPMGHHYLLQNEALRHLYKGKVWTGSQCHDFSSEPGAEQKVIAYLDKLKANGINTMRLFLEDHSLNVPNNGKFDESNCAYWLESPRGNYNPKMAEFLVDLLRMSAERGIYVLINPFDTFYYDDYLARTPWFTGNGGTISHVNEFFHSQATLQMAKERWSWVIQVIQNSGYGDAVFGYEIMNEWDSFEWTRSADDANEDAKIRVRFIEQLAQHVKSLDDQHMLLTSNTALDPRGALGAFIYYSDLFDATLPHLYLPSSREPWNNPASVMETAIVQEHTRAISWWTLNQLNRKPILNGEWGPADGWLPNPARPDYFSDFQETDDESVTRKLWFTELASGAAGPGIRMQGGIRAFDKGLHLSPNMLGIAKTITAFTENGKINPVFDFTDFASEYLDGQIKIEGTAAKILVTGSSDGRKGLAYLVKDQNKASGMASGAILTIDGMRLPNSTKIVAEFWSSAANQTAPLHHINGEVINNHLRIRVPDFNDDWAIRFYPTDIPSETRDDTEAVADRHSCATFANNRLHIPCVSVVSNLYSADFNLSNSSPMQFTMSDLQAITHKSNKQCVEYKTATAALSLPCVTVSNASYWANLQLINSNPVRFQLLDAGQM